MNKTLICTNCPLGCILEATFDKEKITSLEGNGCKRGEQYAEKEIFHPERVVTTTVRISGASIPFIPVKTENSVPKKVSFDVMKLAFGVHLHAPIKAGDVVIKDLLGTGVDLIATRTLERI